MIVTRATLTRYSLLFVVAVAGRLHGANSETIITADRAKVAVMASDVTVDGVPRPDIAQALADSFSAGLLRKGDYRVYQSLPLNPIPKTQRAKKGDIASASGPAGVASGTSPRDVDLLFVFTLVGQGDDYRFLLKKVKTSDNEVLEVHEITTTGKLDKVFGLIPTALQKIQKPTPARQAPKTASVPKIPPVSNMGSLHPAVRSTVIITPTKQETPGEGTREEVPYPWNHSAPQDEFAGIDFSKVPKALIYQRVGSIQFINEAWKFCIIRPLGAAHVGLHDPLHVLYDEDGRIYANLRVANFDNGRVIADFGGTPGYHRLYPGDEVFGWAPPAN